MSILALDASRRLALTFSQSTPDYLAEFDRLTLVTIRAAARTCGVSPATVALWIATGAWPLPRAVNRGTSFFKDSDVARWVATGLWPGDAHFRQGTAAAKKQRCEPPEPADFE